MPFSQEPFAGNPDANVKLRVDGIHASQKSFAARDDVFIERDVRPRRNPLST